MEDLEKELRIAIKARTDAAKKITSTKTIEQLKTEYDTLRTNYVSASPEERLIILPETTSARVAYTNKLMYETANKKVIRLEELIEATAAAAAAVGKRRAEAPSKSPVVSKRRAAAAAASEALSKSPAASLNPAAAQPKRFTIPRLLIPSAAASSTTLTGQERDFAIRDKIYEEDERRRASRGEELGKRLRKTQLIENIIRNYSTISRLINIVSDYNTQKDSLISAKELLDNVNRDILELDSIKTQSPILYATEVRDEYIALQEELVSKQKDLIKNILNKIRTDSESMQRNSRTISIVRIDELKRLFNIAQILSNSRIFTQIELYENNIYRDMSEAQRIIIKIEELR
jgi:hypothetical protein